MFALLLSSAALAICYDPNGDGECDLDNCPGVYNPDQADDDGDGVGNACDPDYVPTPSPQATPSPQPTASPSTPVDDASAKNEEEAEPSAEPPEEPQATASPQPTVSDPFIGPGTATPSPSPQESVGPQALVFALGIREVVIPLPGGVSTRGAGLAFFAALLLVAAYLVYRRLNRDKNAST